MRRLLILLLPTALAAPSWAEDIAASAPGDVSVTVYRAPFRNGGSISLNSLGGFAVVTETRRVTLPPGEHRLRFEGVLDGIIAESAIVSGLPGGVIEKNRDAALLSPSALMRAALGKDIMLKRTDPVTGKVRSVPAEITSASEQGITFKTAAGIEALRCTGLPETFRYASGAEGLSAKPTLSVRTRSTRAVTATVTLTYIAERFDWAANYTAQVSPDGSTVDIGGWITLANGNSVSLPNARTQIVAGGLNRAYVARFITREPQVLARCWPAQRTDQIPRKPDRPYELVRPYAPVDVAGDALEAESIIVTGSRRSGFISAPAPVMAPPPPPPPPPEQLGDLKLYRVPQRTTIAAMQMKQTRLIEQQKVPVDRVYTFLTSAIPSVFNDGRQAATVVLRTRNDKAHNLGLPLPAGEFIVQQDHAGRTMLVGQPGLKDTAEDEKVELVLGAAPDVTVTQKTLARELIRKGATRYEQQVEVANASPFSVNFELRLTRWGTQKIVATSAAREDDNGLPVLKIAVPANDVVRFTFTSEEG